MINGRCRTGAGKHSITGLRRRNASISRKANSERAVGVRAYSPSKENSTCGFTRPSTKPKRLVTMFAATSPLDPNQSVRIDYRLARGVIGNTMGSGLILLGLSPSCTGHYEQPCPVG